MHTKTQNSIQCSENDADSFTAHENPFSTQLPDIRHIIDGNVLSANADARRSHHRTLKPILHTNAGHSPHTNINSPLLQQKTWEPHHEGVSCASGVPSWIPASFGTICNRTP